MNLNFNETDGQMEFIAEMWERQISAREFFSNVLLDSLEKNFGLKKVLIFCFDLDGDFLSWIDREGIQTDGEEHPYRRMALGDVVRHLIYRDAVRDGLTYFNTEPRVYRSVDVVGAENYEQSDYVRLLEEVFGAHYSVTMAFGMNAYIDIMFLKTRAEGDFSETEMRLLNQIYVFVATAYKNFKKHEQAKIISNIQSEIIASGERAYLVTDDFRHVLSCNQAAQEYLHELLGDAAEESLKSESCSWLPFLLGNSEEFSVERAVTRVIKNYIFKIYTYDQSYHHGIVDRYHWITILKKEEPSGGSAAQEILTATERRVARLLAQGLTYKAIAEELVVSYHTVKNHVQNIYGKCGVKSRYELCKWLEGEGEF